MAVEKLDLKAIWESGQHYGDWLKSCEGPMVEDLEKFYKEVEVPPDVAHGLEAIKRPVHVLAISEAWCGDVRRNTPVVARLCACGSNLHLRVVDKETKPELMVRFLTNAAEAIPIFVFFNDQFTEVGCWGPRPSECKRLIARGKASGKMEEAREKIRDFYGKDRHQSTIKELKELFDIASAEEA